MSRRAGVLLGCLVSLLILMRFAVQPQNGDGDANADVDDHPPQALPQGHRVSLSSIHRAKEVPKAAQLRKSRAAVKGPARLKVQKGSISSEVQYLPFADIFKRSEQVSRLPRLPEGLEEDSIARIAKSFKTQNESRALRCHIVRSGHIESPPRMFEDLSASEQKRIHIDEVNAARERRVLPTEHWVNGVFSRLGAMRRDLGLALVAEGSKQKWSKMKQFHLAGSMESPEMERHVTSWLSTRVDKSKSTTAYPSPKVSVLDQWRMRALSSGRESIEFFENTTRAPSSPPPNVKRTIPQCAVITAVFGGYERTLKPIVKQKEGTSCEFIAFADKGVKFKNAKGRNEQLRIVRSTSTMDKQGRELQQWAVDYTPYHRPHVCDSDLTCQKKRFRVAKWYKMQFFKIPRLREMKMVIWLDGTVSVDSPHFSERLWNVLRTSSGDGIAAFDSPVRRSLFEEVFSSALLSTQKAGAGKGYRKQWNMFASYILRGYCESSWFPCAGMDRTIPAELREVHRLILDHQEASLGNGGSSEEGQREAAEANVLSELEVGAVRRKLMGTYHRQPKKEEHSSIRPQFQDSLDAVRSAVYDGRWNLQEFELDLGRFDRAFLEEKSLALTRRQLLEEEEEATRKLAAAMAASQEGEGNETAPSQSQPKASLAPRPTCRSSVGPVDPLQRWLEMGAFQRRPKRRRLYENVTNDRDEAFARKMRKDVLDYMDLFGSCDVGPVPCELAPVVVTCLLGLDLTHPAVVPMLELWWQETQLGNDQDQVTLRFVQHQLRMRIARLGGLDGSDNGVRGYFFRSNIHTKHSHDGVVMSEGQVAMDFRPYAKKEQEAPLR